MPSEVGAVGLHKPHRFLLYCPKYSTPVHQTPAPRIGRMTREPILQPPNPSSDDDRALRPAAHGGNGRTAGGVRQAADCSGGSHQAGGIRSATSSSTDLQGSGKTTFATCIPRDLGVSFQIASGATLKAPKDLVPYLTNAEENSVLFIDEIHRMQKAVEEFLYPGHGGLPHRPHSWGRRERSGPSTFN